MRKFLLKFLLFSLLIVIQSGVAAQSNILKTSLSGFFLGDFSLSYERQTFENQSVQLRAGYFQPVLSPFISGSTLTPSEYTFVSNKGSLQSSLEYRFYTAQAGLKGFYLGPYIRYYSVKADYTDMIKNDRFDVEGSFTALGFGVQLGYHFVVNEIFSADISFFGAGIDKNLIKLIYTSNRQGFDYNTIVDDVTDVFEGIPYFEKRLKNEVNPGNLTSRIPFLFPGLRAGITVGIAF